MQQDCGYYCNFFHSYAYRNTHMEKSFIGETKKNYAVNTHKQTHPLKSSYGYLFFLLTTITEQYIFSTIQYVCIILFIYRHGESKRSDFHYMALGNNKATMFKLNSDSLTEF